jgi:hypothetical protein
MTLMDSSKSLLGVLDAVDNPKYDGVTFPLLDDGMGDDTVLEAGLEKVPRDPSGNESVWMSIEETAVVGFDWRGPVSASEILRRGGRGGGGVSSRRSLRLAASSRGAIVKSSPSQ